MGYSIASSLDINPFRTKTPKYLFPRGNEPRIVSSEIGNMEVSLFSLQISNFCMTNKIILNMLAILSNLHPRIVIFNLCICCQFEDSDRLFQPKIIPMSHATCWTVTEWLAAFFAENFLFLLVHNSEFLSENLMKNYCIRPSFWCGLVLNGLRHLLTFRQQGSFSVVFFFHKFTDNGAYITLFFF